MKPILSSSLINCHVEGLDSIVLKASAPMVRIYLARKDHKLWMNDREEYMPMSIGLHQHRTDIAMVPLFGEISNILIHFGPPDRWWKERTFIQYEYSSKIRDGKGGFSKIKEGIRGKIENKRLTRPTLLKGEDAHSVFVPYGETAAWMICEGAPFNFYSSTLLSNDPKLEGADFSNLYLPMTQERLDEDMEIITRHCGDIS